MTLLAKIPTILPFARLDPAVGSRRGWTAAVLVTLAAAFLPALVWPGDISWMNDEAELIAQAWFGNKAHVLVQHGLAGNFSVIYGPLPTQVYQLLLLITHDPLRLVQLRAALCSGVTAISLLWLARSLRLNPWFATAVVLTPYVWMFNRLMWDASFGMPLGALGVAAYAAFLRNRSRGRLLLAGACVLWLPLIHPQGLPAAAALGGHMLWTQRKALWRHRVGVLLVVAAMVALNVIYLRDVVVMLAKRLTGGIRAGYPGSTSRVPSLLAPLWAGRLLAGNIFAEADAQLKAPPALALVLEAAKMGTCLVFPLMWTGIGVSVWRWMWDGRRRAGAGRAERGAAALAPKPEDGRCAEGPESSCGTGVGPVFFRRNHRRDARATNARDALGGVAVIAVVLQGLLYGLLGVPAAAQYFFGSFAIDVLLAWLAIDALRRVRGLDWAAIGIYGLCSAGITLSALWQTHQFGYARNTHRPTLANQIEVARELNRYSDVGAWCDVTPYLEFGSDPKLLRCLRMFYPPEPGQIQTRSGRLVIRYVSGPEGKDSRIELIEASKPGDVSEGARAIYVTPRSSR